MLLSEKVRIFALRMNNDLNREAKWSENVVLVDADYVDSVAFNLIVNFERMIGRYRKMAGLHRPGWRYQRRRKRDTGDTDSPEG